MELFSECARPNKDVVRQWEGRALSGICKGFAKNVFTLAGPTAECVKAGIEMGFICRTSTHVYSVEKVRSVAYKSYKAISELVGKERTHVLHADVSLWRRELVQSEHPYLDEVFYDKCGALQFSDILLFIEQFNDGLICPGSPVTFTFCSPLRLRLMPCVVHNYLDQVVLEKFPGWYHRNSDAHVSVRYLDVNRSPELEHAVSCHAAYCQMLLCGYQRELRSIVVYRDLKTTMMSFHFVCIDAKPAILANNWKKKIKSVVAKAMNQILVT